MSMMESPLPLPRIVISNLDEPRLTVIATAAAERLPDVAAALLSELERAEVLPDASMPADVVRIGSTAAIEIDDGKLLQVELVLPAHADINVGRISVLTPLGAALIGLSPGQTMRWTGNDGREHRLTVAAVTGQRSN
jgi:regulator of nucleoside diphosphate kinase